MIIPDLNLLVYAYNDGAPLHTEARVWWEASVNGSRQVGIPWMVAIGFVRLMTHPKVTTHPVTPMTAVEYVESWFENDSVFSVTPGPDHLNRLSQCLGSAGVGANLVTDAHIAALALEYRGEVHSNDSDFARFPGLKWVNPL